MNFIEPKNAFLEPDPCPPTRPVFSSFATAATVLTAEDRFAGATDALLSDEGREQAVRLGLRLSGESIVAVYASPLARTMETARLICKPHAWSCRPAKDSAKSRMDTGKG